MSRAHNNDGVSASREKSEQAQKPQAAGPARIDVRVDDRMLQCAPGEILLNVLMNAGIPVETACGGKGSCHLCRVTVGGGAEHLPRPNAIETRALGNVLLAQGVRLSCQIGVYGALSVRLPQRETPEQRRERIRQAKARRESLRSEERKVPTQKK